MTREEMIKAIYEKVADKSICNGLNVIYYKYEEDYNEFTEIKSKIITEEYGHNRDIFIISDGVINRITFDYITVDDVSEAEKDIDTYSLKIIGHPIMINRLEYVLTQIDYLEIRKSISKEELLLPIDEWNIETINLLYKKDCIEYIYNLIK